MNKEILNYLYTTLGKSDNEIAHFLNVDRTTIVHQRKRLSIPSKTSTGRRGELLVIDKLQRLFGQENVIDMNTSDATAEYDILLNRKLRIEVKTSLKLHGNQGFQFYFSNKPETGITHTQNVWVTRTGRTIKKLHKTCDFVVLVCLNGIEADFVIMPSSHEVFANRQTLRMAAPDVNRFKLYHNNFNQLKGDSHE